MTRRPASWQAEKARTKKALRELPLCELCGIKKALGYIADPSNKTRGIFHLKLACPSCAQDAKIRTEKQRAAPRES